MLQKGTMYECDVVKNDENYRKDALKYIDLASSRTIKDDRKISIKEISESIKTVKESIKDEDNLYPKEIEIIHEISHDEFSMIYNAYIYGFSKGIRTTPEEKEEDESFYLEEWF